MNLFYGRIHRGRVNIGQSELEAPEWADALDQGGVAYSCRHSQRSVDSQPPEGSKGVHGLFPAAQALLTSLGGPRFGKLCSYRYALGKH